MTWMDEFKADLLKLVQKSHPEAVQVTDWDEDTQVGGFCDTCRYDEIVVDVYFICGAKDCKHYTHTYRYNGKFAELMSGLADGWL